MRARGPSQPVSYAGSIMLAHPGLRDPNFRKTVVLMTAHGTDAAMGVVLNRPLNKRLGQLGGDFEGGPLMEVPLFQGGPVKTEQLIIAAWRSHEAGFQLHLGIEPDKVLQFAGGDGAFVRGFFGYSGWGAGQLEDELKQRAWIVAPPPPDLFTQPADDALWRNMLVAQGDEWRLLADEPEEAGEN